MSQNLSRSVSLQRISGLRIFGLSLMLTLLGLAATPQIGVASDRERPPLDLPSGGTNAEEENDPSLPEVIVAYGTEYESSVFLFCFDRSLSMTHSSYDQLQQDLADIISQLSDDTRFSVLAFGVENTMWSSHLGSGHANKLSAKQWVLGVAKECMPGSVQTPPAMLSARECLGDASDAIVLMFTSVMPQCAEATAMAASAALAGKCPVHVVEFASSATPSLFSEVLAAQTLGTAKVVDLD